MSYNESHRTTIGNFKEYSKRIKTKYATKTEFNALKSKVDGLVTAGGEPNKIDEIKVNGTALNIANKIVDILIATGSANGTIAANGVDIAVKGLAALAYKANVSESDLDSALKSVIDAKAEDSDVSALQTAVETLNGTGDGSVKKTVADEIAKIVAGADEDFDTLKEISDWISSHSSSAAEMNSAIQQNTSNLSKLTELVGTLPVGAKSETIVEYIAEAIAAIGIGDYAKMEAVTQAINTSLAGYYTKTEIDGMVATDEEFEEMLDEVFSDDE